MNLPIGHGADPIRVRFHPDPPEDGGYPVSEMRPDIDVVNEIVDTVADAEGDLCIAFVGNVGATPYLRPTPYRSWGHEDHPGVVVRLWSCISQLPKFMPARTILMGRRVPIWPDEPDRFGEERRGFNVNMFTREWVWAEVRKVTHVKIVPAEESPFLSDWWNWHWDEREGGDGE